MQKPPDAKKADPAASPVSATVEIDQQPEPEKPESDAETVLPDEETEPNPQRIENVAPEEPRGLPDSETTEPAIIDPPRLQTYTPSSMFDWGQFEAKFFQQLYTQTRFFDGEGKAIDQNNRSSYYSGIGNLMFGINRRLNLGLDFWVRSVYVDPDAGSAFRLLGFPGPPNGRTAFTAFGPKVKFQPFSGLNGFTLQTAFLIPVAPDLEGRNNGRPYLASENFLSWTQIFYTHNFSRKLQLFSEVDLYWDINRGEGNGFLATPASFFMSYFPTGRITVYVMNQFWPVLGNGGFSSWWYQAGLGGKVQLGKAVDLELMYGRFLAGRNAAGPATALNLGFRFVKW